MQALAFKIAFESKADMAALSSSNINFMRETLKHSALVLYQKEISEIIHFFKEAGYERVYSILNAIVTQSTSSFPLILNWGTCAFTGLPSSQQLQIENHYDTIHVDVIFAPLVHALWLAMHVTVLETSRLHRITLKDDIQNSQGLEKFTETKRFLSDNTTQQYFTAFHDTLNYLRAVRSKLDTQM